MAGFLSKLLTLGEGKQLKHYEATAAKINGLESEMQARSDQELRALTAAFRERAQNGEDLKSLLPEAFAAVREASVRTLGHASLRRAAHRRHGILHEGQHRRDEDRRGQDAGRHAARLPQRPGRQRACTSSPSTTTWPSATASGWARSTASWAWTVGLHPERHAAQDKKMPAYNADITYGTNNEFGFDYLRDNMVHLRRRGLRAARPRTSPSWTRWTPSSSTRPARRSSSRAAGTQAAETYNKFARVMVGLVPEADFDMDEAKKTIDATETRPGEDRGHARASTTSTPTRSGHAARTTCSQAHQGPVPVPPRRGLRRGERRGHHRRRVHRPPHVRPPLLRGPAPGASRPRSACIVREENQTLATITLPELLPPVREALRHDRHGHDRGRRVPRDLQAAGRGHPARTSPVARKDEDDLVYRTVAGEVQRRGRRREPSATRRASPCLIGTVSIESSEKLSRLLDKRGIKHEVLERQEPRDARHDIVAQAGTRGRRHHRHEHGRPRHRHPAGRQPRRAGRRRAARARARSGRRTFDRGRRRRTRPCAPTSSARTRWPRRSASCAEEHDQVRRGRRPAPSSAPSATSRAVSTTSCAAVPAVRATPA